MLTVHMIGNAHLDPVWLWRRQHGADEALATSDALLNELVRQQAQPPIIFDRYEGLNRLLWRTQPPAHLQKPLETNVH
jgi:alpha-mannosidase